jgi:hypothetical protein
LHSVLIGVPAGGASHVKPSDRAGRLSGCRGSASGDARRSQRHDRERHLPLRFGLDQRLPDHRFRIGHRPQRGTRHVDPSRIVSPGGEQIGRMIDAKRREDRVLSLQGRRTRGELLAGHGTGF